MYENEPHADTPSPAADLGKEDETVSASGDGPHSGDEAIEQAQFDVPEPPVTGEPLVDQTLDGLGELADLPTAEHVAVYDGVHQRLSDALTDIDQSGGGTPADDV